MTRSLTYGAMARVTVAGVTLAVAAGLLAGCGGSAATTGTSSTSGSQPVARKPAPRPKPPATFRADLDAALGKTDGLIIMGRPTPQSGGAPVTLHNYERPANEAVALISALRSASEQGSGGTATLDRQIVLIERGQPFYALGYSSVDHHVKSLKTSYAGKAGVLFVGAEGAALLK